MQVVRLSQQAARHPQDGEHVGDALVGGVARLLGGIGEAHVGAEVAVRKFGKISDNGASSEDGRFRCIGTFRL